MYQERSAFAREVRDLYRHAIERNLSIGEDSPLDEIFYRELEFFTFVLFDVSKRNGVHEETYWRFHGIGQLERARRIYMSWMSAPIEAAVEAFFSITQYLLLESIRRDGMLSADRFSLRPTIQRNILKALDGACAKTREKPAVPSHVL